MDRRTWTTQRTARHRTTSGGFTLLELIVALLIAGLLASIVVTGVGRSSDARQRRAALVALVSELSLARVRAMERSEARTITVSIEEGSLNAAGPMLDRSWPFRGASFERIEGEPPASRAVTFRPDGRTTAREWRFDRSSGARTIWFIRFDPVSGAPMLVREESDGTATEGT